MTLQQRLDQFKAGFKERVPADKQAIMQAATESLRNSGILDKTIKVGDTLPSFNLINQDQQNTSSDELIKKGPLVISFFRGIWCPYCNIELEALNDALPAFESKGASLVTIAPQLAEHAKKNQQDKNLDFNILVDKGNEYAGELGIAYKLPDELIELYKGFKLILPDFNGDESWRLPMPARLLVDQQGTVIYANISPDYTVRPETDEILALLAR